MVDPRKTAARLAQELRNTFGEDLRSVVLFGSVVRGEVVPGVSDVVSLAVAGYTTCVLLGDGRVQCWGQAHLGQVGDGLMDHDLITCTVDCQLTPVFVLMRPRSGPEPRARGSRDYLCIR